MNFNFFCFLRNSIRMEKNPPLIETVVQAHKPREELTHEQRVLIIDDLEAGEKISVVARKHRVSRGAVRSTLARYKNHGTFITLERKGRPRSISDHTRRQIVRKVRNDPLISMEELCKLFESDASESSIRAILRVNDLSRQVAKKKNYPR